MNQIYLVKCKRVDVFTIKRVGIIKALSCDYQKAIKILNHYRNNNNSKYTEYYLSFNKNK